MFFDTTLLDYSDTATFIRWKACQQFGMATILRIAKYCRKHHGTPDLLAYHPAIGIKAIEVKLGHESIKHHQLATMHRLLAWNVPCEVWRIMSQANKVRSKQIDLDAFATTNNLKQSTTKIAYNQHLSTRRAKT